jgi:diguanylate cyclase (GGDEF)-like protein
MDSIHSTRTNRIDDEDKIDSSIAKSLEILCSCINSDCANINKQEAEKIREYIKAIERLSMTDQLTSLPNRRSFEERLNLEYNRAMRDETPLSLLIVDLDNLKTFNDTHGHLQGDSALKMVAAVFKQSLKRATDFIARWGGDEYAVILSNTNCDKAFEIAEIIRGRVANTQVQLDGGLTANVTVSIGINTQIPPPGSSADDFVHNADDALYSAKNGGRNKICRY